MKTSVFPLIGLVALAFTQCGGSGGDFSNFDMTAESFIHSGKYFLFQDNRTGCLCLIKPIRGSERFFWNSSITADDESSADTVSCGVGVFYTNHINSTTFIPTQENQSDVQAEYTYNGDGSATLTLRGTGTELSGASNVLFGTSVSTDEDDDTTIGNSSDTETTLSGTITIYLYGSTENGTYTGVPTTTGDAEQTAGGSGQVRLYRN